MTRPAFAGYHPALYWNKPMERYTAENRNNYGADWKTATGEQKRNRIMDGFRGYGKYSIGKFARGAAKIGSRAAMGYLTGGVPGAIMGGMSGFGDYSGGDTSANQIIEQGDAPPPLQVNGTQDLSGDIYIARREFVQNITVQSSGAGTSGFQIIEFPLNPGLTTTFPWLSQLAQNFILYDFEGLIFQYVPTSGQYGSANSNALGKVVFCTQYDPDAPPFTSAVQMENYDYSNSCQPGDKMIHGVETARKQGTLNNYYIRTGTSAKDKTFTDLGTFYVATEGIYQGQSGTAVVGELWVTYRIKLSRANLYGSLLGLNVDGDNHWGRANLTNPFGDTNAYISSNSTLANSFNLTTSATTMAAKASNSIGGSWSAPSRTRFIYTFPTNIVQGSYMIAVSIVTVNNTDISFSPGPAATNAITSETTFNDNFGAVLRRNCGSTASENILMYNIHVKVAAPGNLVATVTFNTSVNIPDQAVINCIVTQISDSILK